MSDIKENPDLAQCEFRVHNKWIKGDMNQSEVFGYFAAGSEQRHRETFRFLAAEPELLAGTDSGANPVELLLSGLSACMTTTIAYYAALNGHKIEKMESEFKGELDLQGLLNLDAGVRPGYQKIKAKFKIKTDTPVKELEQYYRFSPVYDVVSKSVPVEVSFEAD
ncbi:OsmC family protein [Legionella londiniensis]|uniref:OsmC family protein n=1 Tax=Legionella londiniensis TaxID=45068 RepID=UPI001ED98FD9|nr:OsmC family protein [Legionella londiniensis]